MFEIFDLRQSRFKPSGPTKISSSAELLSTNNELSRVGLIKRIRGLKADLLNGCLIDLIVELEREEQPQQHGELIVEITGTYPTYGGQYLRTNFHPKLSEKFLEAWAELYRCQIPRGKLTYQDRIVVTACESEPGWWIIRLEKGPNI